MKTESVEGYWRKQYDLLRAESTPATIRSLRQQLQTIRRLCRDAATDGLAETVKAVEVHARIALAIEPPDDAIVAEDKLEQETDASLFARDEGDL